MMMFLSKSNSGSDAGRSRSRRASLVLTVGLVVFGLVAAAPAAEALTIINAAARGWYSDTGSSNGLLSTNSYYVGDCCNGLPSDTRNWFEFDLTEVTSSVTGATLLLDMNQFSIGFESDTGVETYELFDVLPANMAGLGSDSLAIWGDLGTGTSYGTHEATASDVGTTVAITLNSAAIAAINASLGSSFALGGLLTT
jgi:hypothetical protein